MDGCISVQVEVITMKATQTVQIIIEKSKNAFWAYAPDLEGVTGVGETVQLAKESVIESVDIQKELGNIPNIDYNFTFNFDVESLLNYYKGIFTNSALEKITGINQKQLQHYASGLKKPREAQIYKIEIGLHRLAEELLAVKL